MLKFIRNTNAVLWLGVLVTLGLIVFRMYNPEFLGGYSELNEPPAIMAAVLFLVVLVPGIAQRMGLGGLLIRYLIVYRRTLGLLMYLSALAHFLFLIDYLPWFSGGIVKNFDALTASGVASMTLLLPALFTSNNASVRLFKKHWKTIQRVTYITIPLIGIHLWQSGQLVLAIIYIVVTLLILISYFMQAQRKNTSPFITGLVAMLVILLASGIAYFVLRALFQAPAQAEAKEALSVQKAKIEELEMGKILIEKERNELQAKENQRLEEEKRRIEEEQKAKDEEEARIKAEKEEAERIAALSDYKDGTYTANGPYVTDGGKVSESLDVTLGIKGDIVTSVSLVGHLTKKKSEKYHDRFEKDIAGIVIGKDIDTLNVHGIGGASDTSTGFRTALARIKAQSAN